MIMMTRGEFLSVLKLTSEAALALTACAPRTNTDEKNVLSGEFPRDADEFKRLTTIGQVTMGWFTDTYKITSPPVLSRELLYGDTFTGRVVDDYKSLGYQESQLDMELYANFLIAFTTSEGSILLNRDSDLLKSLSNGTPDDNSADWNRAVAYLLLREYPLLWTQFTKAENPYPLFDGDNSPKITAHRGFMLYGKYDENGFVFRFDGFQKGVQAVLAAKIVEEKGLEVPVESVSSANLIKYIRLVQERLGISDEKLLEYMEKNDPQEFLNYLKSLYPDFPEDLNKNDWAKSILLMPDLYLQETSAFEVIYRKLDAILPPTGQRPDKMALPSFERYKNPHMPKMPRPDDMARQPSRGEVTVRKFFDIVYGRQTV